MWFLASSLISLVTDLATKDKGNSILNSLNCWDALSSSNFTCGFLEGHGKVKVVSEVIVLIFKDDYLSQITSPSFSMLVWLAYKVKTSSSSGTIVGIVGQLTSLNPQELNSSSPHTLSLWQPIHWDNEQSPPTPPHPPPSHISKNPWGRKGYFPWLRTTVSPSQDAPSAFNHLLYQTRYSCIVLYQHMEFSGQPMMELCITLLMNTGLQKGQMSWQEDNIE